jgi:ribonuclease Z
LRERAFRTAPGQRIAYVTDAAGHPANAAEIIRLARGADQFFIEAVFLECDRELAERHRHLTAAEAGRLARSAAVGRVTPFHFSARYLGREEELRRELADHVENGTA